VLPAFIDALARLNVTRADLPGNELARALPGGLVLDFDAAGHGWSLADAVEPGKVDLLGAILHEFGHQLGLDHAAGGFMNDVLGVGQSWRPTTEELDDILEQLA
jgi:hypothetical protein